MEVNLGHLEVLHSKFHDPTISNLGDQSGQTDKETKRQTDNVIYYVDFTFARFVRFIIAIITAVWQVSMTSGLL